MHTLTGVQCALREVMQRAADRAVCVGLLICLTQLPDDLLLAHHHRVQTGGHLEHMLRGGIRVVDIQVWL